MKHFCNFIVFNAFSSMIFDSFGFFLPHGTLKSKYIANTSSKQNTREQVRRRIFFTSRQWRHRTKQPWFSASIESWVYFMCIFYCYALCTILIRSWSFLLSSNIEIYNELHNDCSRKDLPAVCGGYKKLIELNANSFSPHNFVKFHKKKFHFQ
jgi:hypothetical protein